MDSSLTLKKGASDERRVFRAKRGDVKLALLDLISENPGVGGYRLMKIIRERSDGTWKVSAGSVYPKLEELEFVDGYVSVSGDDRCYRITEAGEEFLEDKGDDLKRIWNFGDEGDEASTALEQELSKLMESLRLALSTDPSLEGDITEDVKGLRKKIFLRLAGVDD